MNLGRLLLAILCACLLFGSGVVVAINLDQLIWTNPHYEASWEKVMSSGFFAFFSAIYLITTSK